MLVGAIGVSSSSVENDHNVAEAGVEVLGVSELPEHPPSLCPSPVALAGAD